MPWKHRTRICQYCCSPFFTKNRKTFHCSSSCGQRHKNGLGPKLFDPAKDAPPKPKKQPVGLLDADYQAWFWSQVDKSDTCWRWIGQLDHRGYGIARRRNGTCAAHRQSWMMANGSIGNDDTGKTLVVRHQCRPKCCINPDHLKLGTNLDNIRDRMIADRELARDRDEGRLSRGYARNNGGPQINNSLTTQHKVPQATRVIAHPPTTHPPRGWWWQWLD